MLEWSLEPEAGKPFKGLQKDFLDDVLNLVLATGVATGGGENARLVTSDEFLEAIILARDDPADEGIVRGAIVRGRDAAGRGIRGWRNRRQERRR